MTREVRFNVKSDTISTYAPPQQKKKLTKKLTKAPRLNDPSITPGVKPNPVLIAKREMQDAKKLMLREARKYEDEQSTKNTNRKKNGGKK